jgi:hypothetical protein
MASSLLSDKATWEQAMNNMFHVPDTEFEAYYASIWSPNLVANIDGHIFDHDSFKAHMKNMRSSVGPTGAQITVRCLFIQGIAFAERHSASAVMKDGQTTKVEGFCFGEVDKHGLIQKFDEAIIVEGSHPMKGN